MESSEDWFDPPHLSFFLSLSLPPSPLSCTFSSISRIFSSGSHFLAAHRKSQPPFKLAGPSAGWLIAEVSLCQMTNRVSLSLPNPPAGAQP